jgi:Putative peptidoglycan binding domain
MLYYSFEYWKDFLAKYGYLDPKLTKTTKMMPIKEAVIEFQKFNGLPLTGTFYKLVQGQLLVIYFS